ncbi:MAG: protein-tyrosine-phosphatase [Leeuwenhoekiella sp.]
MYSKISQYIDSLDSDAISQERKDILQTLINFIVEKKEKGITPEINFICTHNSRRSQLAQIWAQTIAEFYKIPIKAFSGGVEVTAFYKSAINTIEETGFKINKGKNENPKIEVGFAEDVPAIITFSKIFDDDENPKSGFAAVMTCSHADENCPFIAGAEKRIPIMYEDPKIFDGTPQAAKKYAERNKQIATEMKYVFSQIKK